MFVREIPNKPPPPYTPPIAPAAPAVPSVLPATVEEIKSAAHFSVGILYKAHLDDALEVAAFDEKLAADTFSKNNIEDGSAKFLFDICKELAVEHYAQFKKEIGPSWTHLTKKQKLLFNGPMDKVGLEKYLSKKLRQLFGYEKVELRENAIISWSRKKRDHVDEILVLESQAEESQWTNYDCDELYVKNEVTNEIMNMLLSETAEVLNNVLKKKALKLY